MNWHIFFAVAGILTLAFSVMAIILGTVSYIEKKFGFGASIISFLMFMVLLVSTAMGFLVK